MEVYTVGTETIPLTSQTTLTPLCVTLRIHECNYLEMMLIDMRNWGYRNNGECYLCDKNVTCVWWEMWHVCDTITCVSANLSGHTEQKM